MRFWKKKKEKEVIRFLPSDKVVSDMDIAFERAFSRKSVVISFINIFFAFLISNLIEEPLVAVAHYLRTQEWTYLINNIIAFAVFVSIILGIMILIYMVSRPLREVIYERIKYERQNVYKNIISIVFAILIVDIFIDPFLALSYFIASGFQRFDYDLGNLIDKIIASMILLIVFLLIFSIRSKIKSRKGK